ncbi:MAG: hypothetical protein KDB73_16620 [Planctomycetes bacterium]|nr:hypothetical protein [Planctomycetota bacterium]
MSESEQSDDVEGFEGIDYDECPDPFAEHRGKPEFERIVAGPRDEDDSEGDMPPPFAEWVAEVAVTDGVNYSDRDILYAFPDGPDIVYAWMSTFDGSWSEVRRSTSPLTLGEAIAVLESDCPVDWWQLLTEEPDSWPGAPERQVYVSAFYGGFDRHLELLLEQHEKEK